MPYEKRDAAFEEWMTAANIQLPTENEARRYFWDGIRKAFNAGWAMRKKAEYRAQMEEPRGLPPAWAADFFGTAARALDAAALGEGSVSKEDIDRWHETPLKKAIREAEKVRLESLWDSCKFCGYTVKNPCKSHADTLNCEN